MQSSSDNSGGKSHNPLPNLRDLSNIKKAGQMDKSRGYSYK